MLHSLEIMTEKQFGTTFDLSISNHRDCCKVCKLSLIVRSMFIGKCVVR
jgi:hypothetical protein